MTSPRSTGSPAPTVNHVLLPKQGHGLAECEDAFACNRSTMRFAVADGATESFDAASWAQRLVTKWVNSSGLLTEDDFWTWLNSEGQAHNASWNRLDLPWYSMEKRRAGSFAAFVGIEIQPDKTWHAVALGDSCFLHCRTSNVLMMFPVSGSNDFGSGPVLAPSCTEQNMHARSAIARQFGELADGDRLLLLSDAVASWYIKLNEQQDHKRMSDFEQLLKQQDETAISNFLELERVEERLKDDDVAIVWIEF